MGTECGDEQVVLQTAGLLPLGTLGTCPMTAPVGGGGGI